MRYRGEAEPTVLEQAPTETTAIVLDLDGTGVLAVTVSVREPRWDVAGSATVDLFHPATGDRHRIVLDPTMPTDRWTAVVRTVPGPVRYTVSWHRPGGDLVEPERETVARDIVVEPPPSLFAQTCVQLVAVGSFDGLAQLIVEVRTGSDAPAVPFAFTAAGQDAQWSDPGLDPAALTYQSRQTLVDIDGGRTEFDWVDQDAPVLVAGDQLRFDVLVQPRLLDLGGRYRLALLELAPGPANPTGPAATLVLAGPRHRAALEFPDGRRGRVGVLAPARADPCDRATNRRRLDPTAHRHRRADAARAAISSPSCSEYHPHHPRAVKRGRPPCSPSSHRSTRSAVSSFSETTRPTPRSTTWRVRRT